MGNVMMKNMVKLIAAVILAAVSIFVLSKSAASPESYSGIIESLDEKKSAVMKLTAASTTASAAITLLPGDTATPIAEKLADLSSYFLVVICAIFLEKYLLTITGFAAFGILIPIACMMYAANVFLKHDGLGCLARKFMVFGIVIVLVIPVSVQVSTLIESTFDSSINETIDSAIQVTSGIEDSVDDAADAGEGKSEEGLLSGLISKVKDEVSKATDEVLTKAENAINNLLEALAVMIVTSCLIPVVVIMFFIWLSRMILESGSDVFKNGQSSE